MNISLDDKEFQPSGWLLCKLEEWLMRMSIQRYKCDAGHNRERMLGERLEGVMLDRNIFEKAEKESPESLCYTSMP